MQDRLLLKSVLLFSITICLVLGLQSGDSRRLNQVRDRRALKGPGFFRTLFSVVYEQYADTKNTFNNVTNLINDNFLPENAPVTTTTISSNPNVSTTEAPFKITRTELNRILNRNLKGLVRLFNIELQDALQSSQGNYVQYRKNASLEVSKFL